MFLMPGVNILTDTFDSFRVIESNEGGITKHERKQVLSGVPCRVYNTPNAEPSMRETAATVSASNTLCCEVGTDIEAGDEIIVYRASRIRPEPVSTERYFAGLPNTLVEPAFGSIADLSHVQVALFHEKRIR